MKKIIITILFICVFLISFSGCGQVSEDIVIFGSYMVDNEDTDKFLASDALFAYETANTETSTFQTVYIWNNLLRRELRLDIRQIYDALPKNDKTVILKVGEEITINGKEIDFEAISELSFSVLCTIFPAETQINAKDLRNALNLMIIRLETVDYLGDTEVIAIQTATRTDTIVDDQEYGRIIYVSNLDEIR